MIKNINEPPQELDINKPVRTRDGRKARIIGTDIQGDECRIAALISDVPGIEIAGVFDVFGRSRPNEISDNDLINVPDDEESNTRGES